MNTTHWHTHTHTHTHQDWVKLTTSTTDLAGVGRLGGLRGYRLEEIRQHRTEHDAWAVFNGKVYNITPYLHYHPGGADIMWKAAGRDCTALFNRHHPWVNLEGLAGVSTIDMDGVESAGLHIMQFTHIYHILLP